MQPPEKWNGKQWEKYDFLFRSGLFLSTIRATHKLWLCCFCCVHLLAIWNKKKYIARCWSKVCPPARICYASMVIRLQSNWNWFLTRFRKKTEQTNISLQAIKWKIWLIPKSTRIALRIEINVICRLLVWLEVVHSQNRRDGEKMKHQHK